MNKAYGQKYMVTPHLDKLADTSLVFNRAYTQFAICSCSRNAFLSGRRPDQTKVWNFINNFRQVGPNWISLPEYFKTHNYTTLGGGKIYHPGRPPHNDEPKSWSQDYPYYEPPSEGCKKHPTNGGRDIMCPDKGPYDDYFDYKITQQMLKELQYANNKREKDGNPFFIGIGVHKPHIPWHVPEHFTTLYPSADKIPAATDQYPPKGSPSVAFTAEWDGLMEIGIEKGFPGVGGEVQQIPRPNNTQSLSQLFQKSLRLGYYSAVSYVDYLLGLAMDELDRLGLTEDTLVVFTADHGYQLGEHDEWGKHTNWELATRVPMIIRAPWKKNSTNKRSETFAELQDLYRTMANLVGLPDPGKQIAGNDLSPAFDNPSVSISDYAYSQYSRCTCHEAHGPPCRHNKPPAPPIPLWFLNNCEFVPRENITFMGYTVRTAEWRYTEWARWNGEKLLVDWRKVVGQELYSHKGDDGTDFNAWENVNVATDHPEVVKHLSKKLREYAPGIQ
eukprot:TRINITY_DN115191_c0_g1_i1.p1 TRINITY_DN115191_c0_g1~~TRINITY_DN115191_c0_g1_i1.p1  ORF type:complete len:546 (+),score=36.72 TRINITY_DN115191_c0_g1_i1:136-1638(+)